MSGLLHILPHAVRRLGFFGGTAQLRAVALPWVMRGRGVSHVLGFSRIEETLLIEKTR